LNALIEAVRQESDAQAEAWRPIIERAGFAESARNLAAYMAVRRRDLRGLQRDLMALGLSSLGRMEGRVMPTLLAVRTALAALGGHSAATSTKTFFAGERRLAAQTRAILGKSAAGSPVALLVTCPTEAAVEPAFMLDLAKRDVRAVRINCAHDDADAWSRMIGHLRAAEATTGRRLKVFMDLAGPKIRTGYIQPPAHGKKIHIGDLLAITRSGQLEAVTLDERHFAVECTLNEALDAIKLGDRIFVDDGKLAAEVERIEVWGVVARATMAEARGYRLKAEKAVNFPDTDLEIDALTDKDRVDLAFVAANADGIEFSFVQSAADVRMLQDALAEHRPDDWREMTLILKIETARAVANLPEIIVQAAGRQPTAIMIARGDLSVEIGFARTAEMQEEILWLGEAASVPVIWATQVLEHLVKKGTPSRGEMTDAAMAARAECVMLNKGPYLLEAIDQLQILLRRMDANQHKKAPKLRELQSW
jgi:pyruvate kinase